MTAQDYIIAPEIALSAWTIRHILMQPDMILYRYWIWLDDMRVGGREWLAKPLGWCATCFAGQIALWGFFWNHRAGYGFETVPTHIFFICLVVFFTRALERIINE